MTAVRELAVIALIAALVVGVLAVTYAMTHWLANSPYFTITANQCYLP